MRSVNSKNEYYALWQSGALGINKPLSWSSIEEVESSGYVGTLSLRTSGKSGGGMTKYLVPIEDAKEMAKKSAVSRFNPSMPDDKILIQGEVMYGLAGIELFFTTSPNPMHVGLAKDGGHIRGLSAKQILKAHLDPASYQDIFELLDQFSSTNNLVFNAAAKHPVVEFSTFACNVGAIPGRNTIIWEVRNY